MNKSDLPPNNRLLYTGLVILFLILIGGIIWVNSKPKEQEYNFPSPEEVVRQYFESWDKKDWPNMYATLSDGFKKIDPYAKNLATFKEFADSQGIENIEIVNIKEISNDGSTASVSYSVKFILSGNSQREFSDKFTLKFRQGDVIQGWKLIHPYGENIDTN